MTQGSLMRTPVAVIGHRLRAPIVGLLSCRNTENLSLPLKFRRGSCPNSEKWDSRFGVVPHVGSASAHRRRCPVSMLARGCCRGYGGCRHHSGLHLGQARDRRDSRILRPEARRDSHRSRASACSATALNAFPHPLSEVTLSTRIKLQLQQSIWTTIIHADVARWRNRIRLLPIRAN